METQTRIVRCPTCKKSTRYDSTNEFRPFCSAFCKNRDIIAWAEGQYQIAGPTVDEDEVAGSRQAPQDEAED